MFIIVKRLCAERETGSSCRNAKFAMLDNTKLISVGHFFPHANSTSVQFFINFCCVSNSIVLIASKYDFLSGLRMRFSINIQICTRWVRMFFFFLVFAENSNVCCVRMCDQTVLFRMIYSIDLLILAV